MLRFIGRHWRGDGNFWIGLLVFSIVLPLLIIGFGSQQIGVRALQDTPQSRMAQAGTFFAVLAGVTIWQLLGTWRASSKVKSPGRWFITRWLARIAALATAGFAVSLLALLPAGFVQLYATATDNDEFGKQGYSVMVDGDNLVINGAFAWGVLDKTRIALAENGEIRTVILDSGGGHVGVGTRLGDMIKERGLDTMTTTMCASACTSAFLAGERRLLRQGARLGFHDVAGDSAGATEQGRIRATEYFHATGLSDDFITRIFATPAAEVWWPTYDELKEANVITGVVK